MPLVSGRGSLTSSTLRDASASAWLLNLAFATQLAESFTRASPRLARYRSIAEASATKLFALNYRLTPEHPHPAQIEDAVAAYRWLLGTGVHPSSIILAGDSAGGHLTLMTLLELRKLGLPQPGLA